MTLTMTAFCSVRTSESCSATCPSRQTRTLAAPSLSWACKVGSRKACMMQRGKVSSQERMTKTRLYASLITSLVHKGRLWATRITLRSTKMWRQRCSQVSCECYTKCCLAAAIFSAWKGNIRWDKLHSMTKMLPTSGHKGSEKLHHRASFAVYP